MKRTAIDIFSRLGRWFVQKFVDLSTKSFRALVKRSIKRIKKRLRRIAAQVKRADSSRRLRRLDRRTRWNTWRLRWRRRLIAWLDRWGSEITDVVRTEIDDTWGCWDADAGDTMRCWELDSR